MLNYLKHREKERESERERSIFSVAELLFGWHSFELALSLKGSTKSRSWDQVHLPRAEVAHAGTEC